MLQSDRLPTAGAALGVAATGVLYALAAPPIGLWPLAWLCLVPLLRSLEGRGAGARAALGIGAGLLAALLTIAHPLGSALSRFLDISYVEGLAAASLVGLVFGGVGFGIFGLLAGDPRASGGWAILRVGAAWVAADLFRSVAFTGLPWLLLGHLLAPAPEWTRLAAFGGTALVSFWVACVNAAMLAALRSTGRTSALAMLALLAAAGVGARFAAPDDGPGSPGAVVAVAPDAARSPNAVRVALVQPAVPDAWRRDPSRIGDTLERLADLTRAGGDVDLVAWPENAVHVLLPANEGPVRRALERLEPPPRQLLLGAPRFDVDDPGRVFNSAVLLGADGRLLGFHDKVHLVPFTEYVPARLRWLLPGGPSLAAGAAPRVVRTEAAAVGPLICYEVLFARLARALVLDGAELLVNLSNDGWFGGTGGAEQHLAAVVLRAVELGRPVLRSTSDGITVAVDASGRVAARLEPRVPGVAVVDVRPAQHLTPFARYGDVFAWLALAAALAAGLADARRGPSPASN